MKKILGIVCVLLMILGIAGTAGAALVTISDYIFYDDINELYWYDNPGNYRNNSLTGQLQQIANTSLTVGNDVYDDWTMASQSQVSSLVNANSSNVIDWRDVFDGTWIWNSDDELYELEGRAQASSGFYGRDAILKSDPTKDYWYSVQYSDLSGICDAWVVQESPPNPVSEPTTMLLLGSGLVGLAGFGRKKIKK
jgi:hypothetical protein